MEVLDKALEKGGMIEGIRKAQDDGLIKVGLGFTYHGVAEQFKAAVDCGEFLCATISYNLANLRHEEQVKYATEHGGGYCKECPSDVNPPRLMTAMRDFDRTEAEPEQLPAWLQSRYIGESPKDILERCTACGACEDNCTQHLKIIKQIQRATAALS